MRVESTITESNGSSSMATVCACVFVWGGQYLWLVVGTEGGGEGESPPSLFLQGFKESWDEHPLSSDRSLPSPPHQVCGGCLAMMDAGVPITRPVAGIAMGLILEPDGRFSVLSDILGSEDALGGSGGGGRGGLGSEDSSDGGKKGGISLAQGGPLCAPPSPHYAGDMDFKVAGDRDAITAFQMDIKVEGITLDIMRQALQQVEGG